MAKYYLTHPKQQNENTSLLLGLLAEDDNFGGLIWGHLQGGQKSQQEKKCW